MRSERLILTASLMMALTGTAAAAPAVVTNNLNLRSGPGTSSPVTQVMSAGQIVEAENCAGNWCQVTYGDNTGYASRSYLRLASAEGALGAYAQATGPELGASAVVTNDLNLRSGPGTRYRVMHVMPAGQTVAVHNCSGYWCQVTYGETTGYASQRYLGLGAAAAATGAYAEAPIVSAPGAAGNAAWGYGWNRGWFGRPYYRGPYYGSYYRGGYYGRPYYRGRYYRYR